MMNIYKTVNGKLEKASIDDERVWIDLTKPNLEEINLVVSKLGVHRDFITSVLDTEESSRIDIEDDQILIVVNVAVRHEKGNYRTIPLGIIAIGNCIITVSLYKFDCLDKYRAIGNRLINTDMQSRFTLQLIYQVTTVYLSHLHAINTKTAEIEEALYSNMKEDLFVELLKIEKTLVYFRNSLSSNKSVLDKLFRSNYLKLYDNDVDLLDDIHIEAVQAMEMAETSAEIIRSIRDGISSLMSNRLNVTMQALAAITIILTIPTMVFSFYGMNVNLGNTTSTVYPIIIIVVTIVITIGVYILMRKRKFF